MSVGRILRLLVLLLLMAAADLTRADAVAELEHYKNVALTSTENNEIKRTQQVAHDEAWRTEFNQRSWEWHLWSTKITFYVVIGTVLFGLFLSFMQFTRAERLSRRKARQGDAGAPASSIKLGTSGIEVNSQVIGLLILAFSLGFFYLYVKEIYPMTDSAGKVLKEPVPRQEPPAKA